MNIEASETQVFLAKGVLVITHRQILRLNRSTYKNNKKFMIGYAIINFKLYLLIAIYIIGMQKQNKSFYL
jgi:hypothetical protein